MSLSFDKSDGLIFSEEKIKHEGCKGHEKKPAALRVLCVYEILRVIFRELQTSAELQKVIHALDFRPQVVEVFGMRGDFNRHALVDGDAEAAQFGDLFRVVGDQFNGTDS